MSCYWSVFIWNMFLMSSKATWLWSLISIGSIEMPTLWTFQVSSFWSEVVPHVVKCCLTTVPPFPLAVYRNANGVWSYLRQEANCVAVVHVEKMLWFFTSSKKNPIFDVSLIQHSPILHRHEPPSWMPARKLSVSRINILIIFLCLTRPSFLIFQKSHFSCQHLNCSVDNTEYGWKVHCKARVQLHHQLKSACSIQLHGVKLCCW